MHQSGDYLSETLSNSFYDITLITIKYDLLLLKQITEILNANQSSNINPIIIMFWYNLDDFIELLQNDLNIKNEIISTLSNSQIDDFTFCDTSNAELLFRIQCCNKNPKHYIPPNKKTFINEDEMLIVSDLKFNESTLSVRVKNELVNFTLKEFKIFSLLVKNPNTVYSREQIANELFDNNDSKINQNSLRKVDVHMRRIRVKLGSKYANHLSTLHGSGYYWKQ